MFLGEYQHTLDGKGRLILPAAHRDDLAGGVVLTLGRNRCIDVLPKAEFEREARKLEAQVETGEATLSDLRVFAAKAYQQVPDGQGRVTIPAPLREYARLERDLTVAGAIRSVQIWDRELWAAYQRAGSAQFAGDTAGDGPEDTTSEGQVAP